MIAKTVAATSLMMIDLPSNSPVLLYDGTRPQASIVTNAVWMSGWAVMQWGCNWMKTAERDGTRRFQVHIILTTLSDSPLTRYFIVLLFSNPLQPKYLHHHYHISLFGLAWPHWYDNTTYYSTYNVMPRLMPRIPGIAPGRHTSPAIRDHSIRVGQGALLGIHGNIDICNAFIQWV